MKINKKKFMIYVVLVVGFAHLCAMGKNENTENTNSSVVKLRILAQQPGTSLYAYATTMSQMLTAAFPPNTQIEVIPRGGSMSNPTVLNQGDAEIAFGLSYTTALAYKGDKEVYEDRGPHTNIRAITAGMHMSYTFIMARKAYVEKCGCNTLEQMMSLKDIPRIAMKPQGSVVIPISDSIFKSMGTNLAEIREKNKLIQGQPSQIGEMLRDSRVDVYIDNVPFNHAGVTEVTMTNDIVFIPISEKAINILVTAGMSKETVPAGTYKGLNYDYITPATGMIVMANKNTADDIIYLFTKTIVEQRELLVKDNAALSTWIPEKGMKPEYVGIPLHSGAKRYYDERGW